MQRERYQDLQREVEHDLLVKQALRSRERTDGLVVRVWTWLRGRAGALLRHRQQQRSIEARHGWTVGASDDEDKIIPLGGLK
ncbi:MAG TPA: hypothetical protein VF932_10920 [Anaerolineae bacterium]